MFKQKKSSNRRFKKGDNVIDFEEARARRKEKRQELKEKNGEKVKKKIVSPRKAAKKGRLRRGYLVAMIFVVAVLVFSALQVIGLIEERNNIRVENERLKEEKDSLTNELQMVNDPEYVEQQAREQLRMIEEGELLVVMPEEEELEEDGSIVPQT